MNGIQASELVTGLKQQTDETVIFSVLLYKVRGFLPAPRWHCCRPGGLQKDGGRLPSDQVQPSDFGRDPPCFWELDNRTSSILDSDVR